MPYKSDRPGQYIRPEDDRRRRLSDADRERIRELYTLPDWSQRRLAGEFGVSRRLIQFILDPDKDARNKERFAAARKDGRYYDKDKHAEAMRAHRAHKHALYEKGQLSAEQPEIDT